MNDANVTSKVEIKIVPQADEITPDIWHEFRQIEVITLELTQRYKHSLGKYSRFFIELENGRFFGTLCPSCEKMYAPPRPLCPDCLKVTEWYELPGTGTLKTYSVMHFTSGANEDVQKLETPVVLAYVLMDGASTLFPHVLRADPATVQTDMRVQVAYATEAVNHPIHLMNFVPLEG